MADEVNPDDLREALRNLRSGHDVVVNRGVAFISLAFAPAVCGAIRYRFPNLDAWKAVEDCWQEALITFLRFVRHGKIRVLSADYLVRLLTKITSQHAIDCIRKETRMQETVFKFAEQAAAACGSQAGAKRPPSRPTSASNF